MRRPRKTKIGATHGPSSSSPAMIRSFFDAGVDMFRLKLSHGNHEDHRKRFEAIRNVERDVSRPIGIMMDLRGRKTAHCERRSQFDGRNRARRHVQDGG
ncbi:pyruvate kinase [Bradyrhizobium sp. Bra78]|uniref:pyruvate kinase n=1 Tax=Bradyrhizobium sp. Bra78 TaxID=2926010 RepID=UPI0021C8E309|nr:pyruvate kinase [Bradyrhizobium sp. Bra78]